MRPGGPRVTQNKIQIKKKNHGEEKGWGEGGGGPYLRFLGILKNKFTKTLKGGGGGGRKRGLKNRETHERGERKGKIIQNKIIGINLLS